jgi:hypothetical protein
MKKRILFFLGCIFLNALLHAETTISALGSIPSVTVTFADGSGFLPGISKGSANQALGRFKLTGSFAGASLTAASIKLNGTRTGLSNLKLWESADATFGSDIQRGTTVAADPGNGSSVAFSGFSSAIGTGGTYYFLSGDVASDATGGVQGVITANSSLTFSGGLLSGTISNAPLSTGDVSLPVGLVSFSARADGRSVVLNWITESEVNNAGFILERSGETGLWLQIASYNTHAALKGQGNTSSAMEYAFTDRNVDYGRAYAYRLSDVAVTGKVTAHVPLSVSVTADVPPETTIMEKAYPNPFNPETFISYRLSENTRVEISVFDMLGRRVRILHNGYQPAGRYHVYWNGTDETGQKAPSGGYVIRMETEEALQAQRVLMLK